MKSRRGGLSVSGDNSQRNAVAPSSAQFRGEQFGIDLVLVRLQEILESDDVRLDHLEDSETAVQAEFPWFRHEVVLGVILQDEQPGVAGLLMVGRIPFRPAANGGHADAVGIAEMEPCA